MTPQVSFGIALWPILMLGLLGLATVLIIAKFGRRGVMVLMAGLLGVGVLLAIAGVFHARQVVRNDLVYERMNTYPTAMGESVHGVEEAKRSMEEARRSVEEVRDVIAQEHAEAQARLSRERSANRAEAAGASTEMRTEVGYPDAVTIIDAPRPEPWRSVAELGFEADVHASAASAAEALVVQILKAKDVSAPDVPVQRVQVWTGPDIGGEVLSKAIACLQRKRPEWQVMTEAVAPERPLPSTDGQAATLQFDLLDPSMRQPAPWDSHRAQHGGVVRIRFTWPGGSLDRSTQYIEKPWVENASEFASAAPQMRWVVGCSSSDAADVVAARQEAIREAARQITPETRVEIQRYSSAHVGVDDRWLQQQLAQALTRSSCLRDQFTQTLITPSGGQVTRMAILVQSPSLIHQVAAGCTTTVRGQHRAWLAMVFSAAGMLVLVCLLGLLLNSFTKGYYRGRIVVVAGLAIVLGTLLFFRFAASAHYAGTSAAFVGYASPPGEPVRFEY